MSAVLNPEDGSAGTILDNHISLQTAAVQSGYNAQYLRRLVREGAIEAVKVGQVWLVSVSSLEAYLKRAQTTDDRRFGPRVYQAYMSEQTD